MQHTLPRGPVGSLELSAAAHGAVHSGHQADHAAKPADHAHHEGASARFDRLGAVLGFLCALHCIAVPLLMGVLPSVGLEFLADERVDAVIVSVAAMFAIGAAILGYRQHRDRRVVFGFAGAVALLVVAQFMGEGAIAGRVVSIVGGLTLAVTHLANMRIGRRCAH